MSGFGFYHKHISLAFAVIISHIARGGFGRFPSLGEMCHHFTMLAKKMPSVIFNFILRSLASGFGQRLFFLPQDENFLSRGVSFLGQKRAVGKWKENFSAGVAFTPSLFTDI